MISRKIDANFPAYERVIPKSNDKQIDFDKDKLSQASAACAALERAVEGRQVRHGQGPGRDHVEHAGNWRGSRSHSRGLRRRCDQICFNADYVDNFLGVVETENVRLEFKDEMSQAVMKPIGAEGYEYTYVIMPMRI